MLFRIKILVEYDGTNYCGWQKQKEALKQSIQSEIEFALKTIFQRNIEIFVAGRTDAGVHAKGQIAHFDLSAQEIQKFSKNHATHNHCEEKMITALNTFLTYKEIAILDLEIFNIKNQDLESKNNLNENELQFSKNLKFFHALDFDEEGDFHSRFSAKQKTYIYKIVNRKQPLGLYSSYFWHVSFELPLLDDLEEISSVLVGEHDFSSFRSKFCQSCKIVRNLDNIKIYIIKKNLKPFENEIHFELFGKSFLHNQVRLMVGTMIYIARLKISKEEAKMMLKTILDAKNRSFSKEKAPAHGLYLQSIKY